MSALVESELLIHIDLLNQRYKDAYSVARGIIAVGRVVQFFGVVLGGIVILAGLAFSGDHLSSIDKGGTFIAFITGVLIAFAGYVIGIGLGARGQIMLATIDTAVNTSTLLSQEHKADILGVRA